MLPGRWMESQPDFGNFSLPLCDAFEGAKDITESSKENNNRNQSTCDFQHGRMKADMSKDLGQEFSQDSFVLYVADESSKPLKGLR